ncbi:unnamed protein product [Vitrella brassicaformis CCMP3155]|uniref:Protein kinase domain-containing protein n=1 Tax=Vitrella brassicaformis (strain CCMP3155) TaxID=1169540 RepID=A0A0G4ERC1_VITBC|nr:unnamed protein product [Vitrella brassicaformis CCMP3155]|eukprot:CEL99974.1 unnamed protein product [Vitrella brassicaformis CCMP3155]
MVYRGRFRGREVAVKKMIFVSGEAMTKERLRNVARELNSYRRLRHPNIVGYYGTVNDWPNLGLVTELVRGGNNWRCAHTHHLSFLYVYQFWCFEGNLFELMYERGVEFSAADRIKFANQLTIAVCHLHAADPVVVHRDLKTENCLIDHDGTLRNCQLKLCDFGLARTIRRGDSFLIEENSGSPRYMPPEAFRKGSRGTTAIDVWSLACCIIEIFGGPLPFENLPKMQDVIIEIMSRGGVPKVPFWFPTFFKNILHRCFSKDPTERPTAAELQMCLKKLSLRVVKQYGMDHRHEPL